MIQHTCYMPIFTPYTLFSSSVSYSVTPPSTCWTRTNMRGGASLIPVTIISDSLIGTPMGLQKVTLVRGTLHSNCEVGRVKHSPGVIRTGAFGRQRVGRVVGAPEAFRQSPVTHLNRLATSILKSATTLASGLGALLLYTMLRISAVPPAAGSLNAEDILNSDRRKYCWY